MKTTLRKMYAKIEEQIRNRYWEIELFLNYKKFKNWNFWKIQKLTRDIHPRNIPTNFEKYPNISCRVRGVDGRTDRPTMRHGNRSSGPNNGCSLACISFIWFIDCFKTTFLHTHHSLLAKLIWWGWLMRMRLAWKKSQKTLDTSKRLHQNKSRSTGSAGKGLDSQLWRHLGGGGGPGQVAPATGSLMLVPPRPKEAVLEFCLT